MQRQVCFSKTYKNLLNIEDKELTSKATQAKCGDPKSAWWVAKNEAYDNRHTWWRRFASMGSYVQAFTNGFDITPYQLAVLEELALKGEDSAKFCIWYRYALNPLSSFYIFDSAGNQSLLHSRNKWNEQKANNWMYEMMVRKKRLYIPTAQFYFSLLCWHAITDQSQSTNELGGWLKAAAEGELPEAQFQLGLLLRSKAKKEDQEGHRKYHAHAGHMKCLAHARRENFTSAQILRGIYYLTGAVSEIPKNEKKALNLFLQAKASGTHDAYHALAIFYVGFCHEICGSLLEAKDHYKQAEKLTRNAQSYLPIKTPMEIVVERRILGRTSQWTQRALARILKWVKLSAEYLNMPPELIDIIFAYLDKEDVRLLKLPPPSEKEKEDPQNVDALVYDFLLFRTNSEWKELPEWNAFWGETVKRTVQPVDACLKHQGHSCSSSSSSDSSSAYSLTTPQPASNSSSSFSASSSSFSSSNSSSSSSSSSSFSSLRSSSSSSLSSSPTTTTRPAPRPSSPT